MKSMWKNALQLQLKREGDTLAITLQNPLPHNIPSGFTTREIRINIVYTKEGKVVSRSYLALTRYYKDEWGHPTIPHLSVSASKDMSIPANANRTFQVKIDPKASRVHVYVYFVLVNKEVREMLHLKEGIWSQKMPITKGSLRL
jgi:hypothetical protein